MNTPITPKLELLDNETLLVSPSQLEIIRTCPSMWLYKYLYRRAEVIPDAATQGGHAFDSALNLRYARCGSEPVDAVTEAEMLALIDTAYAGVELPLDEFRTPARYKEVLQAYNAHWQREPFKVLGVQVPFAVELGRVETPSGFWGAYWQMHPEEGAVSTPPARYEAKNNIYTLTGGLDYDAPGIPKRDVWTPKYVRIVLRGLLDLFVQLGEHVVIIDTKTSKNTIGDSYSNSAQMKSYMFGLQKLARTNPDAGLPPRVHAAMINGVIIRPPYQRADRKPTAADKPRNEFIRTFPEFYSQERLEEWRRDTLLWVEQALGWVARGHFPQNERHCNFCIDAAFTNYGYYGKPCPYRQVCTLPAEQRPMMLASDAYMDYARGPLGELGEVKESAAMATPTPP